MFKHLQYRSGIQLSPLCRIDKTTNNSPLSLLMCLLPERYFYYRSTLSLICNDPLKSCSGHNEWRSQT
ncbi:hypothetical protein CQM60_000423 [Salmonella enterica subsp. enterica]|nr:hypothetical protein [Salmonella enterica subsp. enterica]